MKKCGKNDMLNKRNETIDIAKAIAIFAIVLGHVSSGLLWDFTLYFATAGFFLFSGLTFYLDSSKEGQLLWRKEEDFLSFLKKSLARILFPYALWGIISIIVYTAFGYISNPADFKGNETYSIMKNLLGLLYGNSDGGFFEWNRPLWFLPCLFMVELIAFTILKCTEKNHKLQLAACITTIAASLAWLFFVDRSGSGTFVWPFELETALAMLSFFMTGVLIRKKMFSLSMNTAVKRIICIAVCFVLWALIIILVLKRGGSDTRSDLYRGFPQYIYATTTGIAGILLLSAALTGGRGTDWLTYIGKRTLPILVMHKFPIMLCKIVFPWLSQKIAEGSILVEIMFAIMIVAVTLLIEKILSVIAPWAFGLKPKK